MKQSGYLTLCHVLKITYMKSMFVEFWEYINLSSGFCWVYLDFQIWSNLFLAIRLLEWMYIDAESSWTRDGLGKIHSAEMLGFQSV